MRAVTRAELVRALEAIGVRPARGATAIRVVTADGLARYVGDAPDRPCMFVVEARRVAVRVLASELAPCHCAGPDFDPDKPCPAHGSGEYP